MDSAASLNGNGPDVKAAEGHNAKEAPGAKPDSTAPATQNGLPESPDAEPPQKKQRQEPEAEEGKDKEEGAQGFPADTLFRCQRVVELLLQHPYVPHFNQAMGQPNLMTIHGWLQDPKGAGQALKSPADVYSLLNRMFAQFDKICPAEHPLKRVCGALEQHTALCWKQAGLDVFNAHLTNQAKMESQVQQAPPKLESLGEQRPAGGGLSNAEVTDSRGHGSEPGQDSHQRGSIQSTQPTALPSNSPVIALPERSQIAAGPGQSSQGLTGHPSSSLGLGNQSHLATAGRLQAGSGLAPQTQTHGAQGGVSQGLASQSLLGRQSAPQGPQAMSVELQRLRAEAEIKPHERAILEQTMEMRRRRAMFEAASQQAQVAVTQYQQLEQELQRCKAALAQAKAQHEGRAAGPDVKKEALTRPPESKSGEQAVHPDTQVDANCLLSSNPGLGKLDHPQEQVH